MGQHRIAAVTTLSYIDLMHLWAVVDHILTQASGNDKLCVGDRLQTLSVFSTFCPMLAGFDCNPGLNISCVSSAKFRGKLDQFQQQYLEDHFKNSLSQLLKISPCHVSVDLIGDGSITIFFTLPLWLSQRLWQLWASRRCEVQQAFHDFTDKSEEPILDLSSVLDVRHLRIIERSKQHVSNGKLSPISRFRNSCIAWQRTATACL